MRLTTLAATILLVVAAVPTNAQSLSEADIQAAINAGTDGKAKRLSSRCYAKPGFGQAFSGNMRSAFGGGVVQPDLGFDVTVARNAGLIASLAENAKRLYQPFGPSDVPDLLKRESAVFVSVNPRGPTSSETKISIPSPIERVVLKSKSAPQFIAQPIAFTTDAVKWSDLFDIGDVEANSAFAQFSLADVRGLPAGDFDVVVITEHGERRCKVGLGDRKRLFRPK
jgi:hypothetical protein